MQKSKIEWLNGGYTINPVKGLCPMACPYCYARRMYKRFKWDETIRLDTDSFLPLLKTTKRKPSKIFVGSTMELFGNWVKPAWLKCIFERVKLLPEHTFIFLTKQPQNLRKWSPFPDNCWVGVSATNGKMAEDAGYYLTQIDAKVRFLSLEPLQERTLLYFGKPKLDWLIIGQQTPVNPKTAPKIEWIKEIVDAADKANVPVFLKNNLAPLLRQNNHNLYSFPEWAGKQIAVTGDHSLHPTDPHSNEPMRILRQEYPVMEERGGK